MKKIQLAIVVVSATCVAFASTEKKTFRDAQGRNVGTATIARNSFPIILQYNRK